MTVQEAEDFLKTYRAMLKTWTMAVAGLSNVDSDLLYGQLEADQDVLADIAICYPEKSYSVDMLINSRSRTWAGYAAQRLPRPQNRQP
jgi:hypothetical protein